MTGKKGLMERVFGKEDPYSSCGMKVIPIPSYDPDAQENDEIKKGKNLS